MEKGDGRDFAAGGVLGVKFSLGVIDPGSARRLDHIHMILIYRIYRRFIESYDMVIG